MDMADADVADAVATAGAKLLNPWEVVGTAIPKAKMPRACRDMSCEQWYSAQIALQDRILELIECAEETTQFGDVQISPSSAIKCINQVMNAMQARCKRASECMIIDVHSELEDIGPGCSPSGCGCDCGDDYCHICGIY